MNCLASLQLETELGDYRVNTSKDDAEFDPFAHDRPAKKGGGSSAVAWLALLLALGVAGYTAYQWWLEREAEDTQAGLQQSIMRLQSRFTGLEDSLGGLEAAVAANEALDPSADLAALRADVQETRAQVIAAGALTAETETGLGAAQAGLLLLQQRLDALEDSLTVLAERSSAPTRSLDIAEVSYLLRMADERLALFGDVAAAEATLARADEQLEAIGDSLYQPVRRRIAESRQALQAVELPDVPDLVSRLGALQDQVATLPFGGEERNAPQADDREEPLGLWQRFKAALGPLVTVRRRVDDGQVIGLADQDLVRHALWLQFEAARLSLARRDPDNWERALARAEALLRERFAHERRPIQNAIAEVQALREVGLHKELPDIGAAWDQLRLLHRDRSESRPRASAEPVQEVDSGNAAEGDDGG